MVASCGVTVTVSLWVLHGFMLMLVGETLTSVTSISTVPAGSTFTAQIAVKPHSIVVTVMVDMPLAMLVATPEALTVVKPYTRLIRKQPG